VGRPLTLIFCSGGFYLFLLFLPYSHRPQIECLPYFHIRCGLTANLECRTGLNWSVLHAARWKYRTQKLRKNNRHLRTMEQTCRAISSQLRHVSTIGKENVLSSNISSTYLHNMLNFGPLTAEIGSGVWSTPANFNGFRFLASLLHQCLSTEVNQTLHDVWPSPGLVHS